mgnify:FL=1
MDSIRLKGMRFYGRHGLFGEEAALGQRFELDLEVLLDLASAGASDRMEDSVHYGELFETVRRLVEEERFQLIEALGQAIAEAVLAQDCRIAEAVVTVRKPSAPIPGILDYAEVIIRRKRHA